MSTQATVSCTTGSRRSCTWSALAPTQSGTWTVRAAITDRAGRTTPVTGARTITTTAKLAERCGKPTIRRVSTRLPGSKGLVRIVSVKTRRCCPVNRTAGTRCRREVTRIVRTVKPTSPPTDQEEAMTHATTTPVSPVQAYLEGLLADIEPDTSGAVADYIPTLANANPDLLGIGLATVDGAVYLAGDHDTRFSIQSMSKPFTYALAIQERGLRWSISTSAWSPPAMRSTRSASSRRRAARATR